MKLPTTRILNLAKRLSEKSDHPKFKLGCVIFKKNNVVSVGFNKMKTHPRSPHHWKMIHAEFHALLGVSPSDLLGSSVFVYRENHKSGNVGLAKPCKVCEKMLHDVGIKEVYYTTSTGIERESYNN